MTSFTRRASAADGAASNMHAAASSRFMTPLLHLVETIGELDVGAPGIADERDSDVQRGDRRVRPFELDAHAFELLAERLEPLHFEADMIERSTLRPDDRIR